MSERHTDLSHISQEETRHSSISSNDRASIWRRARSSLASSASALSSFFSLSGRSSKADFTSTDTSGMLITGIKGHEARGNSSTTSGTVRRHHGLPPHARNPEDFAKHLRQEYHRGRMRGLYKQDDEGSGTFLDPSAPSHPSRSQRSSTSSRPRHHWRSSRPSRLHPCRCGTTSLGSIEEVDWENA